MHEDKSVCQNLILPHKRQLSDTSWQGVFADRQGSSLEGNLHSWFTHNCHQEPGRVLLHTFYVYVSPDGSDILLHLHHGSGGEDVRQRNLCRLASLLFEGCPVLAAPFQTQLQASSSPVLRRGGTQGVAFLVQHKEFALHIPAFAVFRFKSHPLTDAAYQVAAFRVQGNCRFLGYFLRSIVSTKGTDGHIPIVFSRLFRFVVDGEDTTV